MCSWLLRCQYLICVPLVVLSCTCMRMSDGSGWATALFCMMCRSHPYWGLADIAEPAGVQLCPGPSSAAEVVATCVQNNPPVQQFFLDGGALPKLLKLAGDADPTCRCGRAPAASHAGQCTPTCLAR